MFHLCTIPEADGVPVTVERLQVLLIVNPLFARRANGQTSSSWNNSNTMRQRNALRLQSRDAETRGLRHMSRMIPTLRGICSAVEVRVTVSSSKTSGCQ